MSRFMLTVGLVLASLAGLASAGHGVEASQLKQGDAMQSAQAVAFDFDGQYTDYGPYDYLTDAIAERDAWRADGYGANVITGDDGCYYVRVFEK